MDGNIQNTPPIISGAAGRGPRRGATDLRRSSTRCAAKLDARKAEAKPEFDKWLATATAASVRGKNPLAGLKFHAPLDRGRGDEDRGRGRRRRFAARRSATATTGPPGNAAARRFSVKQTGSADRPCPTSATSTRDQAFTASAPGSSSRGAEPTGAIVARMDPTNKLPRLGPVDRGRQARHAHHQRLAGGRAQGRRQERRCQLNQWAHVAVAYDGSAKAAGRQRSTSNGEPQPTDVAVRHAQGHDARPRCRSRSASGTATERLQRRRIEDVRLYDRTLARGRRSSNSRATAPRPMRSPSRPTSGRRRRRRRRSTGGSATLRRAVRASSTREIVEAPGRRKSTIRVARHDRPRHEREDGRAGGVHPLSAATTTSAATR